MAVVLICLDIRNGLNTAIHIKLGFAAPLAITVTKMLLQDLRHGLMNSPIKHEIALRSKFSLIRRHGES